MDEIGIMAKSASKSTPARTPARAAASSPAEKALMPDETRLSGRMSDALLAWYDSHRRVLPWRAKPGEPADAYRVWLSEIMLQQTTVAAVQPYFEAFTERWKRLEDLAAAPEDAIMKAWAGLGYYSRARNLMACAKTVMERHKGAFPADEKALLALPGIGAYTAAAIASIAFGQRAVVIDGNVERVITRVHRIGEELPRARKTIRIKADEHTPSDRPGDYAQAMMDLGATLCTPRTPSCLICPLQRHCAANAAGDPTRYPIKPKKAERETRRGAAFVLTCGNEVLLQRRDATGLLGGMSGFPGTAWETGAELPEAADQAPCKGEWRMTGSIRHVFTHFPLELAVFRADFSKKPDLPGFWVPVASLSGEALPTVFKKVAAAAFRLQGPRALAFLKDRSA
jgi:A/G-specific adenine glycosylase